MNQKDLIKKIENLEKMIGETIVSTVDPSFRKPVRLIAITNRGNMVIEPIRGSEYAKTFGENIRELPLHLSFMGWKVFN